MTIRPGVGNLTNSINGTSAVAQLAPEISIADDPPQLTRITALRLCREISRRFLQSCEVQQALAGCAELIVRVLPSSVVSISVNGDAVTATSGQGPAPNSRVTFDEALEFEVAVPIPGEIELLGELTVRGRSHAPIGIESLLEEAAHEIGGCLLAFQSKEEAFRRLREESALRSSTVVGVLSFDREQVVTTWNSACRELLGWHADDVVGKHVSDAIGASAWAELQSTLQIASVGWSRIACTLQLRNWEGREKAATVEILPPCDMSGGECEFRLIIRDDTHSMRMRKLLDVVAAVSQILASHATRGAIMEPILREIGSGMQWLRGEWWQYDEVDQNWTCAACWGVGQSPEHCGEELSFGLPAAVGNDIMRFGDFSQHAAVPNADDATQLGLHDAIGIPIRVNDEQTEVLFFFGYEIPELDDGSSRMLRAIAFQIGAVVRIESSERSLQQAEERLVQSQKMEAIGLLAGGIAHDFNNLLTIILASSEIAQEILDEDSEATKLIREVEAAGNRGAALTRQLLAFSRQQSMEVALLNVNEHVRHAKGMLRRLFDDRIRLTFHTEDAIGLVKFDSSQFEQILLNLVVNARDAIPEAGHIIVETRNVTLSAAEARQHLGARPGDYITLTVTDSGCGMDKKTQARIFEPFFTTKEKGKGTGMGLATVYGIVSQCGGFLSINSKPGEGTSIGVHIPRAHEVPKTLEVTSQPSRLPTGTETVLVVEDEDVLRNLVARMLAARGYTVLQAAGGNEAIELLNRKRHPHCDLLVSDVMMPGLTGPKMVAQLRTAGHRMPVLYISGHVDPTAIGHGDSELDGPLLRKPFSSDELGTAVREALDIAHVV